jgi:hypothetical protein
VTGDTPRPNPCPSCPYREDCPSGVWSAEEYDKLTAYDGEIHEQAMAGGVKRFGCHQADGHLCSGWVGHREHPSDLLAIRMGLLNGGVDPATLDYTTDVPLFPSGRPVAPEAAAAQRVGAHRAQRSCDPADDDRRPPGPGRLSDGHRMIDVLGVLVVVVALAICAHASWMWRLALRRLSRGPLAVVIVAWSLIDMAFVSYVILCYWYGGLWTVALLIVAVLFTRWLMTRGWVS